MSEIPAPYRERFYPHRRIGGRILTFAEVDSTMDIARAKAGGGHGVAIRADAQLKGRGRFARHWESKPGDSLLTSTVLRMPPVAPGSPIAVAGAMAVLATVQERTSVPCTIKWPNDVLADGRKIAGVLVEVQVSTLGEGIAVLGIGLNVNLNPATYPAIADIATSLAAAAGHDFDLDFVEEALFRHLDDQIALMLVDRPKLMSEWARSLETLGRQVTVHRRDRVLTGLADAVTEEGYLLLRTPDGNLHTLREGDVTLRN